MIPFDEIDCEIRPLIKLMNAFPGIATEASCAGHGDDDETYVMFRADSQDALKNLVSAMPFLSWQGQMSGNRFHWKSILVDAALNADGQLRFNLRVAGNPKYVQRGAIEEIEKSLMAWVAADSPGLAVMEARKRRPSCPTHATVHNADIATCCSTTQPLGSIAHSEAC